jgi:hypothetical protein
VLVIASTGAHCNVRAHSHAPCWCLCIPDAQVTDLRRSGHVVVVALTRPFGFEGPRKLEAADALVELLETVAQLVVGRGEMGRRAV